LQSERRPLGVRSVYAIGIILIMPNVTSLSQTGEQRLQLTQMRLESGVKTCETNMLSMRGTSMVAMRMTMSSLTSGVGTL
jgi:hypothetical protein